MPKIKTRPELEIFPTYVRVPGGENKAATHVIHVLSLLLYVFTLEDAPPINENLKTLFGETIPDNLLYAFTVMQENPWWFMETEAETEEEKQKAVTVFLETIKENIYKLAAYFAIVKEKNGGVVQTSLHDPEVGIQEKNGNYEFVQAKALKCRETGIPAFHWTLAFLIGHGGTPFYTYRKKFRTNASRKEQTRFSIPILFVKNGSGGLECVKPPQQKTNKKNKATTTPPGGNTPKKRQTCASPKKLPAAKKSKSEAKTNKTLRYIFDPKTKKLTLCSGCDNKEPAMIVTKDSSDVTRGKEPHAITNNKPVDELMCTENYDALLEQVPNMDEDSLTTLKTWVKKEHLKWHPDKTDRDPDYLKFGTVRALSNLVEACLAKKQNAPASEEKDHATDEDSGESFGECPF